MRKQRMVAGLAIVIAALAGGDAFSQEAKPAPTRAEMVKAAVEIMRAAGYCTLATMEGGQPQARLIDAFEPEPDLTVWMATKPNTRKVAQIRKNPRVALLYFDPKSSGYVTLLGEAVPVTDPAEKAKRWKDRWAGLYKDRNRGDDYLLIRVKPDTLEISSPSHGMQNDPDTWQPVILSLR